MRAIDVMVHDVVTVHPDTDVADAINLLAEHDVSALPVVDAERRLVGILSEADLIHRVEIDTEKHRPWWLEAVTGASTLAEEFAKSHGKRVGEVMSPEVVSVAEDTPLSEIDPRTSAAPSGRGTGGRGRRPPSACSRRSGSCSGR